jgi:hypothetical protein
VARNAFRSLALAWQVEHDRSTCCPSSGKAAALVVIALAEGIDPVVAFQAVAPEVVCVRRHAGRVKPHVAVDARILGERLCRVGVAVAAGESPPVGMAEVRDQVEAELGMRVQVERVQRERAVAAMFRVVLAARLGEAIPACRLFGVAS